MLQNFNFHLFWLSCRPLRIKYGISVNCLLTLNGIYLYCKYVKPVFTWNAVFKFVRYFNTTKTANYLTVLIGKGFINVVRESGRVKYYSISSMGNDVIMELNNSYSKEFSLFIDKYDIKL